MGIEGLRFKDRTVLRNHRVWLDCDSALRIDQVWLDCDRTLEGVPGCSRRNEECAEAAAIKADIAGDNGVARAALGIAVKIGVED